jgi:hypothetical protein
MLACLADSAASVWESRRGQLATAVVVFFVKIDEIEDPVTPSWSEAK